MVRAARLELSLTQEQLAEQVGRSQEWVGKIESGEIEQPRRSSLESLSTVLRLPLADFYIAINRAETKSEAERMAKSTSASEQDPYLRVVFAEAPNLSPAGRRALERQFRIIQEQEAGYRVEAERDAVPDRRED